MTQRLVYNPKCWVYTKNSKGEILDITNYVTGGKVDRLVNQVSKAEIRLRNPNKVFTNPAKGVAFHPMDPITIFLERIEGHPVRVFTGFLDTTPYYQMFPGEITIRASCTLKRLQFIFFNPALPYFYSFLRQFGWYLKENGTAANTESYSGHTYSSNETPAEKAQYKKEEKEQEEANQKTKKEEYKNKSRPEKEAQAKVEEDIKKNLTVFGADPKEIETSAPINESSLSHLLWALLFYVAEWKDENIYIEALPPEIGTTVQNILNQLNWGSARAQEQLKEEKSLTEFLHQTLGMTSVGNGGGQSEEAGSTASGGSGVQGELLDVVRELGGGHLIEVAIIVAAKAESNFNPNTDNGTYWGVLSGSHTNFPNPTKETKEMARCFVNGGKGFTSAKELAKTYTEPLKLAEMVEGCEEQYKQENGWQNFVKEAEQIVAARSKEKVSSKEEKETSSKGEVNTGAGHRTATEKEERSSSEKSSESSSSSTSGYVNPFKLVKGPITPERIDMGTDYHIGQIAGEKIVALGDGTFVDIIPGWEQGVALVFQLSNGPAAGHRYYYAEGVEPLKQKGEAVKAGEPVAVTNTQPTGLEFGWMGVNGSPVGASEFNGENATKAGESWDRLMRTFDSKLASPDKSGNGPLYPGGPSEKIVEGFGGSGEGGGSGSSESPLIDSKVAAFTSAIQLPSMEETVAAIILKNQKSFMNDVSLLPFIQEVSQASLRSFMSLPTGDFYAFYPDYFGEFGHHEPYWLIHDIEILEGGIQLSDEMLATHVYVIGDNTWPVANNELFNEINSAGVVNIFNVFSSNLLDRNKATGRSQTIESEYGPGFRSAISDIAEAQAFMARYGARPVKNNQPSIRSPIYEMLMAYQTFCLMWSKQFLTPFEFTFMPELFPGGKVGFPDHGIQMYIEEVSHIWDMNEGYRTEAILSAPAVMKGYAYKPQSNQLPPNMVQALVNPVKGATLPAKEIKKPQKNKQKAGEPGVPTKGPHGHTG